MSNFEALKIRGIDHLEFAVADIDRGAEQFLRLGFERTAVRESRERKLKSYLLVQNEISILITSSSLPSDPVARYVAMHGDGVMNIAFLCDDAVSAFEIATNRGADVAEPPRAFARDFGTVELASILSFGDVKHTFISRKGNVFTEGFDLFIRPARKGFGLERIDHFTVNVEDGQLDKWADFYEQIFGLVTSRFFDIHTARSGLYSKILENPDGTVKIAINEPTEHGSQVQEFIDVHHGAGVQHVGFLTADILKTASLVQKENVRFLEVPRPYYETLPGRVPHVTENIAELETLSILVDGSSKGYLLQVFTQNALGSFFCEILQRKGDDGFGEGNFQALFEAIEQDQIRRGVLKR